MSVTRKITVQKNKYKAKALCVDNLKNDLLVFQLKDELKNPQQSFRSLSELMKLTIICQKNVTKTVCPSLSLC